MATIETDAAPESIDVLDPRTGEVIGAVKAAGEHEVDDAVRAAQAAAPAWARRAPAERSELLKGWARTLRDHADELAELQSVENGKSVEESRGGVDAGIAAIEQYAELGPLHRGRALQGDWGATDLQVHEPRGVVAILVPWNDPVAIAAQNIAAALAVGNTVVFKPSEKTPLSGIRLAELAQIRLPEGVLTALTGDARAGAALVAHPGVDAVMHTGSVATGREIARVCAGRLRKYILELGGKDALIVDAGVDPDWAAEQAASGAFANAGQICVSVERIYVHEAIAEPFVEALTRKARETEVGPLIDQAQRDTVHRHVTDAVDNGADVLTGGELPEGPGFFYPPTVITGVEDDMQIMSDETFGPVAAVRTVRSFDEALERANRTEYGLAATVLSADDEHIQRAWRELDTGTVKVNSVWGGAPGGSAAPHRQSGSGLGYGPELLDELTLVKVVHIEPSR